MDYAPAARGRFDRAAAGLLEREREFPPLEEIPEIVRGKSFTVVNGAFLGSEQDGADLLRPLRELGPQMDTFATVPPAALSEMHMDPIEPVPYRRWGAT